MLLYDSLNLVIQGIQLGAFLGVGEERAWYKECCRWLM